MTSLIIYQRKPNSYRFPKRKRLKDYLEAIGVTTGGDITRDHIRQAHRIFRGARGAREVNDLWTFIKRFVCPRCDGIKWRPKGVYCGSWCSQKRASVELKKSKKVVDTVAVTE